MHCHHCQDLLEPHFAFCEGCGKPVLAKKPISKIGATPTCQCGSTEIDDDFYCQECGQLCKHLLHTSNDIFVDQINTNLVCATHRGKRHVENQDAVAIAQFEHGIVMAVADGVSSAYQSKAAANLAVKTALAFIQNHPTLSCRDNIKEAIEQAHKQLCAMAYVDLSKAEPQATIVLALIVDGICWFGWVGDSRLYVLQNDVLQQLTRDDSWFNDQILQGLDISEASKSANAHSITQCLGMRDDEVHIHIDKFSLSKDALVVLCSDGLWNYCHELAVFKVLLTDKILPPSLEKLSAYLIDYANTAGGHDNITVALYKHP